MGHFDCVFIPIDAFEVSGSVGLWSELGLEHDPAEVLANWSTDRPCVLIIDAFDAARIRGTAQVYTEFLSRIRNKALGWRVVVSVRSFEAKHSSKLNELMRPSRRLEIPPGFSDDEMRLIFEKTVGLQGAWTSFSDRSKDLLRVPFNLRLGLNLLASGTPGLSEVASQSELLDLYWQARVLGGNPITEAEQLLSDIAAHMLREFRTHMLFAELPRGLGNTLDHLMSEGVLVKHSDNTVAFYHAVLADYAIERLVLRGAKLGDLLKEDRRRAFFLYPAIQLHLGYLWHADKTRNRFWDEVLGLLNVPDLSRVEQTFWVPFLLTSNPNFDDLRPLMNELAPGKAPSSPKYRAAAEALAYVATALRWRLDAGHYRQYGF